MRTILRNTKILSSSLKQGCRIDIFTADSLNYVVNDDDDDLRLHVLFYVMIDGETYRR